MFSLIQILRQFDNPISSPLYTSLILKLYESCLWLPLDLILLMAKVTEIRNECMLLIRLVLHMQGFFFIGYNTFNSQGVL